MRNFARSTGYKQIADGFEKSLLLVQFFVKLMYYFIYAPSELIVLTDS